jgi:hypothetical protein
LVGKRFEINALGAFANLCGEREVIPELSVYAGIRAGTHAMRKG